jgi:hypothetical protein
VAMPPIGVSAAGKAPPRPSIVTLPTPTLPTPARDLEDVDVDLEVAEHASLLRRIRQLLQEVARMNGRNSEKHPGSHSPAQPATADVNVRPKRESLSSLSPEASPPCAAQEATVPRRHGSWALPDENCAVERASSVAATSEPHRKRRRRRNTEEQQHPRKRTRRYRGRGSKTTSEEPHIAPIPRLNFPPPSIDSPCPYRFGK